MWGIVFCHVHMYINNHYNLVWAQIGIKSAVKMNILTTMKTTEVYFINEIILFFN